MVFLTPRSLVRVRYDPDRIGGGSERLALIGAVLGGAVCVLLALGAYVCHVARQRKRTEASLPNSTTVYRVTVSDDKDADKAAAGERAKPYDGATARLVCTPVPDEPNAGWVVQGNLVYKNEKGASQKSSFEGSIGTSGVVRLEWKDGMEVKAKLIGPTRAVVGQWMDAQGCYGGEFRLEPETQFKDAHTTV